MPTLEEIARSLANVKGESPRVDFLRQQAASTMAAMEKRRKRLQEEVHQSGQQDIVSQLEKLEELEATRQALVQNAPAEWMQQLYAMDAILQAEEEDEEQEEEDIFSLKASPHGVVLSHNKAHISLDRRQLTQAGRALDFQVYDVTFALQASDLRRHFGGCGLVQHLMFDEKSLEGHVEFASTGDAACALYHLNGKAIYGAGKNWVAIRQSMPTAL